MITTKKKDRPKCAVIKAANCRFEKLLPELQSRCRRIACRYPKVTRRDVAADALAFCYTNHFSCFIRGKRPSAGDLAFFAVHHVRHRSMTTRNGYPDGHENRNVRLCRDWSEEPPSVALAKALSTSERDDPAEQARVKIDWAAFSQTQDTRCQKILVGLAIGETKKGLAHQLAISNCRVSQVLDGIARDVSSFFDGDVGSCGTTRRACKTSA